MKSAALILTSMVAGDKVLGGVGDKKQLNLKGERNAEDKPFYDAFEHDEVQKKMQAMTGKTSGKFHALEYATQVVQGLKYVVKMKDDKGDHYEAQIWQKPLNSGKNEVPAPEVVKMVKLTQDL
jgi:hypothetical protein